MDVNLEEDSTKSIHAKINKYLQNCEISKAEFTVSSDGKTAHLISYRTERPERSLGSRVGNWFVSRLDIIIIAIVLVLGYWSISARIKLNDDMNYSSLPCSTVWESSDHSSISRTVGKDITLETVFVVRCVTNTVSTIPLTK